MLIGNQAANQIIGGLGGDSIFGGNGADILDGGDGVDAVIYTYSSVGVVVNLLTNIQSGGEADGDNLSNIENITGSAYGDQITGNNLDKFLFGYHGDDILNGMDGTDIFFGGLGADQIDGGLGGNDIAYYTSSAVAVTINLTTNVNMGVKQKATECWSRAHLWFQLQ